MTQIIVSQGLEKGDATITEQCRKAELTRAIERRRNTRKTASEAYRTSQVEIRASRCRADVQEKSHD